MEILRAKGVGVGLKKLLSQSNLPPSNLLLRWGSRRYSGTSLTRQINLSQAISMASNKKMIRETLYPSIGLNYPLVIRPSRHKAGQNFHIVNNDEEKNAVTSLYEEWYQFPLIDKETEYRVFVQQGRVLCVAEKKLREDVVSHIWNVSTGSATFNNVKWGDWPLNVCQEAIRATLLTGLDMTGVDVMVEKETGNVYVLEVNSAPSLPFLSDGSVSYRQSCFITGLKYIIENGKETIPVGEVSSWKDIIHPALYQ